jgi:tetratricopeptide (TPR) repeat protein
MKSFAFLILSFGIAGQIHSQIPFDLEVKINLVDTLINHNKFDHAVDILVDEKIRWRKNAHGQAKILLKLGLVYRMLDDHVASNKHFTNALLIPNGLNEDGQIYAYNLIAVNQMDFDDYEKSVVNFRQAIQLIPKAKKNLGRNMIGSTII